MAFTLKTKGTPNGVDVDGDIPLLWVLRDVLGMTGTKFGSGQALCGAYTVHVDGQPVRSCQTPVDSVGDSAITTIEAIGQTPQGAALQKAWLELGWCSAATASPARSCRRLAAEGHAAADG
jgi:isoquinoline 1-oxidoreductase alpha subunit